MKRKRILPSPVRVMDGDTLIAVVSTEVGKLTIRPEPGYRLAGATINVEITKIAPRSPRGGKKE